MSGPPGAGPRRSGRALRRASLVGAVLAASLGAQLALATIPDTAGDSTLYRRWARVVSGRGITEAYFGRQRAPLRYLPVIPYVMGGLGAVERSGAAAPLAAFGEPIDLLVKLPGIASNLAISLLLFGWLRRTSGFRTALLAMTAYAWNPGVAFDTGYWGQTDAIHAFLVLLSIFLCLRRQPELAFSAMALAIFTKPQAWPFAPVVLLLTVRDHGGKRTLASLFAALAVAAAILFPFAREARLDDLFWKVVSDSTPTHISVFAHNVWWLATLGPPGTPTSTAVLPGVTLQTISALLSVGVYAATLSVLWRRSRTEGAVLLGATYVAVSFFMLAPGMHENYLFAAFPFFAAACAGDRRLFAPYAILAVSFLVNMVLHDPFIMIQYFYGHPFEQIYESSGLFYRSKVFMSPLHRGLTLANAAVGVGVFAHLSWRLFAADRLRTRAPVERGDSHPMVPTAP